MRHREAGVVLDTALRLLAREGGNPELTLAILSAWDRYSDEGKASVCLGLGDRFLGSVLGAPPEIGALIAADCLASRDLTEAIIGGDPVANAEFVGLGIRAERAGAGDDRSRRRALVRVTMLFHESPRRFPDGVRCVLDRELVKWASRYDDHRDAGVLRAVLASTRRCGPRLDVWLRSGPMEEHLPLRAAAAKAELSEVAGLALGWLAWPALVPASRRVIERVVSTDDGDLINAMLEPWVVLRARRRSERLRSVLSDRQFARIAARRDLDVHARRGLGAIAQDLGPGAVSALADGGLVADRDAFVRLGLVHAVASTGAGEEADLTLQDLGFDAEAAVAAAAIGVIGRVRSRHRRIASTDALRTLIRCQHPEVRERAQRAIELFDPLARVTSSEARWHCPVAAQWLAKRSPDTLHDLLSISLRDPDRCGDAIALVDRLRMATQFGPELGEIATGRFEVCDRAKATLLLGHIDHEDAAAERAFRSLAELLGDHDDRVRSNAIEAISRLRGDTIRLDRFTDDPVSRVRANAIRHACATTESKPADGVSEVGAMHLDAMLRDDRPEHRVSAIWVASIVRPLALAGAVARMAREDDDATVRARARRCAMRMLSAMEPQRQEVCVA